MPALPSVQRSPIELDRDYLVMTSRLPLRSHRATPGFLRDTMRIRRQLAGTVGLVGYSLNAQLLRKTFWTFSVWADQDALDAFAAAEPHRTIMRRLRAKMAETSFSFVRVRGAEIPQDWTIRMSRLLERPDA